jgi:hypothetical protein
MFGKAGKMWYTIHGISGLALFRSLRMDLLAGQTKNRFSCYISEDYYQNPLKSGALVFPAEFSEDGSDWYGRRETIGSTPAERRGFLCQNR